MRSASSHSNSLFAETLCVLLIVSVLVAVSLMAMYLFGHSGNSSPVISDNNLVGLLNNLP